MAYRHWKVTFRDSEGAEIEGWYNGSRAQVQGWAEARRMDLGAVGFTLTDVRPLWKRT